MIYRTKYSAHVYCQSLQDAHYRDAIKIPPDLCTSLGCRLIE